MVEVPVQHVSPPSAGSTTVTEVTPEPESAAVPQAPGTPEQVFAQRPAAGPLLSR